MVGFLDLLGAGAGRVGRATDITSGPAQDPLDEILQRVLAPVALAHGVLQASDYAAKTAAGVITPSELSGQPDDPLTFLRAAQARGLPTAAEEAQHRFEAAPQAFTGQKGVVEFGLNPINALGMGLPRAALAVAPALRSTPGIGRALEAAAAADAAYAEMAGKAVSLPLGAVNEALSAAPIIGAPFRATKQAGVSKAHDIMANLQQNLGTAAKALGFDIPEAGITRAVFDPDLRAQQVAQAVGASPQVAKNWTQLINQDIDTVRNSVARRAGMAPAKQGQPFDLAAAQANLDAVAPADPAIVDAAVQAARQMDTGETGNNVLKAIDKALEAKYAGTGQVLEEGNRWSQYVRWLRDVYGDTLPGTAEQGIAARAARARAPEPAPVPPVETPSPPPAAGPVPEAAPPPAGGIPMGRARIDRAKFQEGLDMGLSRDAAMDRARVSIDLGPEAAPVPPVEPAVSPGGAPPAAAPGGPPPAGGVPERPPPMQWDAEGNVVAVEGRPVPPVPPGASLPLEGGLPAPAITGGAQALSEAVGPSGRAYQFRYRVADLDELIPSHTDAFTRHPQFPAEIQPRERDRGLAQLQVDQMARDLRPEPLLMPSPELDRGPMIVGADNLVESGNGRILALRRAAQQYPEQAQGYQAALRADLGQYGLTEADLAGKRFPVLVRERVTPLDPAERVAFAAEANQRTTLGYGVAEQAASDAQAIPPEALAGLDVRPGQALAQALQAPGARPFVQGFVGRLPPTEQAGLVDASGQLSQAGLDRVGAALFARVYEGESGHKLLYAFRESLDPTITNLQRALEDTLPAFARLKGTEYDLAQDLAPAVDVLARLRQERLPVSQYLGQATLFERELTPFQEQLLQFLDTNLRNRARLRDTFSEYGRLADAVPPPEQLGLFGAVPRPEKGALLENAATTARATTERGLFDAGQAAPAAAPSAPAGLGPAPEALAPRIEQIAEEPLLAERAIGLPKALQGAKPRYKTTELSFEEDIDKALYVVAQDAKRSKHDARYVAFLEQVFPGASESQLRQWGRQVRGEIRTLVETAGEEEGLVQVPALYERLGIRRTGAAAPPPGAPLPEAFPSTTPPPAVGSPEYLAALQARQAAQAPVGAVSPTPPSVPPTAPNVPPPAPPPGSPPPAGAPPPTGPGPLDEVALLAVTPGGQAARELRQVLPGVIQGLDQDRKKVQTALDALGLSGQTLPDAAKAAESIRPAGVQPAEAATLQQLNRKYGGLDILAPGTDDAAILAGYVRQVAADRGLGDISKLGKVYQEVLTGWRQQALFAPAYHVNNILDALMKNALYLGGSNQFTDLGPNVANAFRHTFTGKTTGYGPTTAAWLEARGIGLPQEVLQGGLSTEITGGVGRQAAGLERLPGVGKLFVLNREIAHAIETSARTAAFMSGFDGILAKATPELAALAKLPLDQAKAQATPEAFAALGPLRNEAYDAGIALSDKLHFNYRDTSNLDEAMRQFAGFHMFATRNIPLYAEIFATHPGLYNAMKQYDDYSKEQQKAAGLEKGKRFEGTVPLGSVGQTIANTLMGPGGQIFFNPSRYLSITGQLFQTPPNPAKGESGLGQFLDVMSQLGIGPNPLVAGVLQVSGAMGARQPSPLLRVEPLVKAALEVANPAGGVPQTPWDALQRSRPFGGPAPSDANGAVLRRLSEMALERTGDPNHPAFVQAAREGNRNPLWQQAVYDIGMQGLIERPSSLLGVPLVTQRGGAADIAAAQAGAPEVNVSGGNRPLSPIIPFESMAPGTPPVTAQMREQALRQRAAEGQPAAQGYRDFGAPASARGESAYAARRDKVLAEYATATPARKQAILADPIDGLFVLQAQVDRIRMHVPPPPPVHAAR